MKLNFFSSTTSAMVESKSDYDSRWSKKDLCWIRNIAVVAKLDGSGWMETVKILRRSDVPLMDVISKESKRVEFSEESKESEISTEKSKKFRFDHKSTLNDLHTMNQMNHSVDKNPNPEMNYDLSSNSVLRVSNHKNPDIFKDLRNIFRLNKSKVETKNGKLKIVLSGGVSSMIQLYEILKNLRLFQGSESSCSSHANS